jgi:hypothetical protein
MRNRRRQRSLKLGKLGTLHLAGIETCAAALMNRMLSGYFRRLEEIQTLIIRARYDVRVSNIVTASKSVGDIMTGQSSPLYPRLGGSVWRSGKHLRGS